MTGSRCRGVRRRGCACPLGSVGIAGAQTGIYPAETPGGWQLIGRTPVKPFDPTRAEPFLLKAGDTVQFYPIERDGVRPMEVARLQPSVVSVIKAGMLTTMQDAGRWGLQSRGVPVAGPMDPVSHRLANALVGNTRRRRRRSKSTLLGPELEFDDERLVAVAGAEFDVDARRTRRSPPNAPFVVAAGSHLRFGARRAGARAYLAVAGGIDVPPVLGSRATHLVSAMGGLGGRALEAGDRVPLGRSRRASHGHGAAAADRRPSRCRIGDATIARAAGAAGATASRADALATFCSRLRTSVGHNSDRMGFRLDGPRLMHARGADIISDATPLGALQVPASGQPILLMADRQTTGGYPKIATVIAADIGLAGQLGPGRLDRVRRRARRPKRWPR